jgi:serine/threonine protein kinase
MWQESTMTFITGEQVGPYKIIEQLGSGGMATVFKAYHASLDRYVAIKVLHPAFKQDPNFLSRFQREARIVAKLEHPHIVPVYDFSEAGGQPYLVMRFIEGETLKARLANDELSLDEVARIMKPVGEALSYAHGQGVLHRDVKPSNVLLTPDGGVWLADFGLARIAQAGESTLSQDSLLGTPQYISPEQAQGLSDLDARTDIYSLAVVMYELLVGRVPYQADTPYAVIHDHIYAPLPLPHSIKPDFPEPLERVLLKALSKERDDRYATVADLMRAFDQAVQQVKASAPTQIAAPIVEPVAVEASSTTIVLPEEQPKSKKKFWIGLGAAAALIVIIVGAIVLSQSSRPQQPSPPTQSLAVQPPAPGTDVATQIEQLRERFNQGNAAIVQGQPERARGIFADVAQTAEKLLAPEAGAGPDQQVQLDGLAGQSWLAAGKPDRALVHLELLSRKMPDNLEVITGVAAAQLLKSNLDAADATLNRVFSLNADFQSAHFLKACLLLKRNEPLRASREFRAAGGFDVKAPVAPWIRLVLADLDCRDDRFQ